jgi:hypothetical protein
VVQEVQYFESTRLSLLKNQLERVCKLPGETNKVYVDQVHGLIQEMATLNYPPIAAAIEFDQKCVRRLRLGLNDEDRKWLDLQVSTGSRFVDYGKAINQIAAEAEESGAQRREVSEGFEEAHVLLARLQVQVANQNQVISTLQQQVMVAQGQAN